MDKLALISVSNKDGVVEFVRELTARHGYRILSTGGTAKLLIDNGLSVTEVGDYTGFPELMEGRIKTLHPRIHGGILCRRDKPEHLAQAEEHGIGLIDLVAVNLYPFEETVARPDVNFEEAVENIDIGGSSMLRSAAKNHAGVTVVCDPADYRRVLAALEDEEKLAQLRGELAIKVFQRTAAYDLAISVYLENQQQQPEAGAPEGLPDRYQVTFQQAAKLRYGENPHQQAALYGGFFDYFEQLQGKQLSFCNILDITAASRLIGEFEKPTLAILKHTNPCGAASAPSLLDAWEQAFATDRQAPFGGIIVVNRTVEDDLAAEIAKLFCEIVIAPEFSEEAQARFAKKKNLRLMLAKESLEAQATDDIRSVVGGILVQDRDRKKVDRADYKVVTRREPTAEEWEALLFGWRVVKHVKSNAIIYASAERTLGIGAGQMSRVDSSHIAIWKAAEAGLSLEGSIMASDALIPFADGLIAAAEAGATAAIQTGGSVRDEEVIAAADEHKMAMVFTGSRHFRH